MPLPHRSNTIAKTTGTLTELFYGDPIPTKGLITRDGRLFEDGKLLGVPTEVRTVMDVRADFDVVTYRPIKEILAELPPEPAETVTVEYCSYPRHRPSDWIADDGARCGICHPPAKLAS